MNVCRVLHVCAEVQTCTCEYQRKISGSLFCHPPPYSLETRSVTELRACFFSETVVSKLWGSSVSILYYIGVTDMCDLPFIYLFVCFSMWVLKIQTWFLMLTHLVLLPTVLLPSPWCLKICNNTTLCQHSQLYNTS